MMKRVLVLGTNGMLGRMVYDYLSSLVHLSVKGVTRQELDAVTFVNNQEEGKIGGRNQSALPSIKKADYVINCIGMIKPRINEDLPNDIHKAFVINGIFPRYLSDYCASQNTRMIHVNSDCCFSGNIGEGQTYHENSLEDAKDIYGKSKILGNPSECVTLRTSIIGPEIENKYSLLEWLFSEENKGVGAVNGYTNHLWNGMTTLELSKSIEKVINADVEDGLYHVFSNVVTKYSLLSLIKKTFGLNITINPVEAEACNRSLSTVKDLNKSLKIASLEAQLEELKCYMS